MIKLDFLGLDTSGKKLTFNDENGNRYEAVINSELRGALRKDLKVPNQATDSSHSAPGSATPKEIQAYFRAGKTVAEVSEICALPPLQLSKLASPILAERKFITMQARSFRKNRDSAEMSVDELVTARLISRGADISTIEWDAQREPGMPWILFATYVVGGNSATARWQVNLKAHFITPLNDEATWLTDTPLPTPNEPWRPLNTPKITENRQEQISENHESIAPVTQSPFVNASNPIQAENLTENFEVQASDSHTIDIDSMLASLDQQRGISKPIPHCNDPELFEGAHPAYSEPQNAKDAQILQFPSAKKRATDDSVSQADSHQPSEADSVQKTAQPAAISAESEQTADIRELAHSVQQSANKKSDKTVAAGKDKTKTKTRKGRPEMPSWDEIIYGYSKDYD